MATSVTTRNSLGARLALRLAGKKSADERDIQARLDQALAVAACPTNTRAAAATALKSAQVIAEEHSDVESYALWRAQQLERIPGAYVPELKTGRWALVLWVLRPSAVPEFMWKRRTARGLLDAPQVGQFPVGVEAEVALAATLAAWLERHDNPVRLAPPMLHHVGGPYRVVDLGREWPLPASDFLPTASAVQPPPR